MLLVKTSVRPSNIQGLGLFADERLVKGTLIWRFTPGFDQLFTSRFIERLDQPGKDFLYRYAWKSKKSGLWCFGIDDSRFFNHSDSPNTISVYTDDEPECLTYAAIDIEIGQELTSDYNDFTQPGGW